MTAPLVWPRPSSSGRDLQVALQHVRNEAIGLTAAGPNLLPAYLRWAVSATARLRPHLVGDDVERLIRTPTFWAALGLNPQAPSVAPLISEELTGRGEELDRVVQSIERFLQRFSSVPEVGLVLVPDTNVLLAHANNARETDWHSIVGDHVRPFDTVRIAIPLLVIDELDRLKQSGKQQTRTDARLVLKLMHELLGSSPDGSRTLREEVEGRGKVTVEILMESPNHVRLPRADDELVDIVARLRAMLGNRTVMATFDTGADFRAAARSLNHVHLGHSRT